MQHGQTKRFFEGSLLASIRIYGSLLAYLLRKKRINQNGDREERRKKDLQAASNNGFSAASHCRMNNGSAGLDEQPSLEKNSEKPCHLERNWLLTYF